MYAYKWIVARLRGYNHLLKKKKKKKKKRQDIIIEQRIYILGDGE